MKFSRCLATKKFTQWFMLFLSDQGDEYNFMRDALDKLKLNDAALFLSQSLTVLSDEVFVVVSWVFFILRSSNQDLRGSLRLVQRLPLLVWFMKLRLRGEKNELKFTHRQISLIRQT